MLPIVGAQSKFFSTTQAFLTFTPKMTLPNSGPQPNNIIERFHNLIPFTYLKISQDLQSTLFASKEMGQFFNCYSPRLWEVVCMLLINNPIQHLRVIFKYKGKLNILCCHQIWLKVRGRLIFWHHQKFGLLCNHFSSSC